MAKEHYRLDVTDDGFFYHYVYETEEEAERAFELLQDHRKASVTDLALFLIDEDGFTLCIRLWH